MTQAALEKLGWNDWFESQASRLAASGSFARVAAVDRDQLLLIGVDGFFRAKLAGRYLQETAGALERPCVGDWVWVEIVNGDSFPVVHATLDRKTSLRRKKPGAPLGFQMIAANVDFVIVAQSCHYDFNVNRLERYMAAVKDGGATPIILLTKVDLITPEALTALISEIRNAGISEQVIPWSNKTNEGLENLRGVLTPGKTYCFVGSSGVGKSTTINTLMGRQSQQTQDVSASGEGRHTTVRRELMLLDNGALVIDNPGMREFGVLGAETGVQKSFADMQAFASACRFRDCSHTNEPGCMVKDALLKGTVSADHYHNYLKLSQESERPATYPEKRKKDGRGNRPRMEPYDELDEE